MISNFLETNDTPPSDLSTTNELGSELRRLREQKGLSIKDVADRLKLPSRQIEALENGLYEGMPEPVFIRGFLRSYGRFLDMDEQRLSSYLDHIAPSSAVTRNMTQDQHDLNFSNTTIKKASPKWILAVLALAIVGAGVYFWQSKSHSENEKLENVSTMPTNNNEVAAPNLNTDNMIVKPMTSSDTATETAIASQVMQQPNTTTPPPIAPAPTVAGVTGELVITTKHRTMLTVTDVNGKVLMNKIVPAATEHRFKEGAPFDVRMGYATDATATFAGQPINLADKMKDGKSAAFIAGETAKP